MILDAIRQTNTEGIYQNNSHTSINWFVYRSKIAGNFNYSSYMLFQSLFSRITFEVQIENGRMLKAQNCNITVFDRWYILLSPRGQPSIEI